MTEQENKTKDLKFYSQKTIGIATFIGGPLAAGYLIRENYRALDKPDEAKNSLLIGIITTIILFGGIFMIPESIMGKVPNQIIPLIYTGITYLIVEKIHGKVLKKHKELKNEFFSGWKATGIGLISLIIISTVIFGYTYLSSTGAEYEMYDTQLAEFSKNETESLVFYDKLNTETSYSLLQELDNNCIPKWKENIDIIKKSNAIENSPSALVQQNETLLNYAELRLKAFELFRKTISEDTDKYEQELEQIHSEIEVQLKKIN